MSNSRDRGPELDYFELRRRHEAYKNRMRSAESQVSEPVEKQEQPTAPEVEIVEEVKVEAAPAAETTAPAEEPVVEVEAADISAEAYADDEYYEDSEEEYEDEEDEFAEDGEDIQENPNPFDSFIKAFHGIRNRLGKKKKGGADEEYDEEEYDDEGEYADDDEGAPEPEAEPIPMEDLELLAAFTGVPSQNGAAKLASFGGLAPGGMYVFILSTGEGDALLAPENLLFARLSGAAFSGRMYRYMSYPILREYFPHLERRQH